jgi:predicted dithiol-disulfide oxidoreductase (DUF899 family)
MPWLAVEKAYEFDGPEGKANLLDLFAGRRQLIAYRAFFEPGVFGWPDHACCGCSMWADQVAHVAHLNARDTPLVFVSRAPQADIARLNARMGCEMRWSTLTDDFDADVGVDEVELPRSPLSGDRKSGKTRRKAIRRRRCTSGGTGTTATARMPRRTSDESARRRRSAVQAVRYSCGVLPVQRTNACRKFAASL